MKETKYDKNDFPDALLKEWDKTRKQILGKEGKENGTGIMGRMKKAKWKSREEHNDYIHAECSGCGFQVESYDSVETGRSSTEYIKAKWKFCPKCGAKMKV